MFLLYNILWERLFLMIVLNYLKCINNLDQQPLESKFLILFHIFTFSNNQQDNQEDEIMEDEEQQQSTEENEK